MVADPVAGRCAVPGDPALLKPEAAGTMPGSGAAWYDVRGLGLEGPRQSAIPNAGISRVHMHDGVVELLQWADTAHLEGMPAQPVYDQQRLAR